MQNKVPASFTEETQSLLLRLFQEHHRYFQKSTVFERESQISVKGRNIM